MKNQKLLHTVKRKTSASNIANNLKTAVEENRRLRLQLLEVTNKQHQEMTRAIQLKEKNILLTAHLHQAKEEACTLRSLNCLLRAELGLRQNK